VGHWVCAKYAAFIGQYFEGKLLLMQWGKGERFGVVCLGIFWIFGACFVAEVLATEKKVKEDSKIVSTELTNKECVKCHTDETKDIEKAGGAHKTKVGCLDCHKGHPPKVVEGVIPKCSECHTGEPHFELERCLKCHSNPHAPLCLKLARKITKPCLTCHETQGQELDAYKSFHSNIACTDCHNKHGEVFECMECHKPHSADMTEADCKLCHQAHKPLEITYKNDISSKACGACHEEEFDLLVKSRAKHHELSCAECHSDRHKTVPECQDCHDQPHSAAILDKFPNCESCHNNPHDLM